MFEDSLVESGGRLRSKRGLTTFISFSLQILLVAVLVLIPLIYTEALPRQQLMTFLVAPPPPPPPPPPAAAPTPVKKIVSEIVNGQLRTPTKIPQKIQKVVEEETPANVGVVGGVPGGVPGGSAGGVLGGVLAATNAPPPKIAAPQKIRVSAGVAEGNLVNKVQPVYPAIAKTARIQGTVVIQATISKNGTIENAHVVSGHPMLAQSALNAVREWRYRPYMLSGEPVEVETTINVNFTLNQ
jgi:protein TonB